MADCLEVLDHLKYTYQPFLNYPPHPFLTAVSVMSKVQRWWVEKCGVGQKKARHAVQPLIYALLCWQKPHFRQMHKNQLPVIDYLRKHELHIQLCKVKGTSITFKRNINKTIFQYCN